MTMIARHTRMLLSLALAALAAAGCSDGKGPTDTEEAELLPDPTPKGTSTGPAVTKTIGPEGGSLTSADGGLTLTVPAGAVSAPTEFGIQPITNQSPGGVGQAYRLTPEGQALAKPVQLSFGISDEELAGASPEGLGLDYQDEDGGWWAVLSTTLAGANSAASLLPRRPDGSAGENWKVIVITKRLRDWTKGWQWRLDADPVTVKVGKSSFLEVIRCVKEEVAKVREIEDELVVLPKAGTCSRSTQSWTWSVNGPGQVTASLPGTAVYRAPASVPSRTGVFVTAAMTPTPKGLRAPPSASVVITVEEDCFGGLRRASFDLPHATAADDVCRPEWTGTSSTVITAGGEPAFKITAQVTWRLDPNVPQGPFFLVYYPEGFVTFQPVDPCFEVSPATRQVTKDNGGRLLVNIGQSPWTYEGAGVTVWAATYRDVCEGVTWGEAGAGGPWFEGKGSVSADGMDIAGPYSGSGMTFTYNFTRRSSPTESSRR